MEATEPRVPSG